MGYRSEVILAIMPEVMPQFMVTMAKSPEARKLCWTDHDNMVKDYCNIKGAFLFRWGGISSGMILLKKSKPSKILLTGVHANTVEVDGKKVDADDYYRFVRIGEEMDDNEVQGYGFDIHIERSATY